MTDRNHRSAVTEADARYTPHEHEESRTLVRKAREHLRVSLRLGNEKRSTPPAPSR
jgi:hypothetical protein